MNKNKIGEIKIEKELLFKVLDGIKKQWDKNPKNKSFSDGIIMMKAGLHLQEDLVIERIVTELLKAVMALEEMGAFQEMKKDENYNDRISFFSDTLMKKIESGEFFNGVETFVSN